MQAYDQHLNMILGDVEETITSIEIDDETYEEIVKACTWPLHMLELKRTIISCITVVPLHADQQANGTILVCERRWCDSCVAPSAVMTSADRRVIEAAPSCISLQHAADANAEHTSATHTIAGPP